MKRINVSWQGTQKLVDALKSKSEIDFKKVEGKNLLEMRDRAVRTRVARMGGTPIDSGELRLKVSVDLSNGIVGYTEDYAPHVEYGHRQKVGRFVPAIGKRLKQPYVKGQYFLKNNMRIQEPKFRSDLRDAMKE